MVLGPCQGGLRILSQLYETVIILNNSLTFFNLLSHKETKSSTVFFHIILNSAYNFHILKYFACRNNQHALEGNPQETLTYQIMFKNRHKNVSVSMNGRIQKANGECGATK